MAGVPAPAGGQLRVPRQACHDIFADYAEQGALVPAWRWELADRSAYRVRSLTTQYEESDFAFVERLLAEEGIAYWFEHAGDIEGDTRGSHTMVLGDHVEAFNDAGSVRFHRADAAERSDSIQQWSQTRRWQTGAIKRASWDYRSRSLRPTSGEAQGLVTAEDDDVSGPYGVVDSAHADLRTQRQMQALQVTTQTIHAAGAWRRQAPGQQFALTQHTGYSADDNRFTCLHVEHVARNNLGAEVFEALETSLGQADLATLVLPETLSGLTADATRPHPRRHPSAGGDPATLVVTGASSASERISPADPSAADFYRNTFTAIPATVAYRPRTVDGHGLRLHPRPTVTGTQTAIVVTDGAPVQTDRDHRIKVQFAWQRGGSASSGRSHPGGDDNAPSTDASWTWGDYRAIGSTGQIGSTP